MEVPETRNGIWALPVWAGSELTTQRSKPLFGERVLNDTKGPQVRKMTRSARKIKIDIKESHVKNPESV